MKQFLILILSCVLFTSCCSVAEFGYYEPVVTKVNYYDPGCNKSVVYIDNVASYVSYNNRTGQYQYSRVPRGRLQFIKAEYYTVPVQRRYCASDDMYSSRTRRNNTQEKDDWTTPKEHDKIF